jgi:hypothetical protein
LLKPCIFGVAFYLSFFGGIVYSNDSEFPLLASSEKTDRFKEALSILKNTPSGKRLTQNALQLWKVKEDSKLLDYFLWGETSRTDTVLTRHFDPKTGLEDRERHVKIYLRQKQALLDLVLDMAHELVHATARPSFDPYDPTLTLGQYIFAAIEGEGGEVDAVLLECQVGSELLKSMGAAVARCNQYLKESKKNQAVDRNKIREDFYRVGEWFPELTERLGKESKLFPLLSIDPPLLYSSTGHAPYPFALLKEFDEITEMACENTEKRMKNITPEKEVANLHKKQQSFIASRCQSLNRASQ